MLSTLITAFVETSRRFAGLTVLFALVASVGMGLYVAKNISINTDINQLLSDNLEWRKREKEMDAAFPQKIDNLVIVVDEKDGGATGGTDEGKIEAAAAALTAKLQAQPKYFTLVSRPDSLPYFQQNGLLFLSKPELGGVLDQMAQAQPMLATVVTDPSLRGFFGTIGLMMQGVQAGAVDAKQITQTLNAVDTTIKAALAGRDVPLDIAKLMPMDDQTDPNSAMAAHARRKYIITKPVLDYSALQPGEAATKIVREAIESLQLNDTDGVRIRLTGSVPLNDQEFSSVTQGAGAATLLSAALVLLLLFIAMKTWRIVLPIVLTLMVGLVASTAFATLAVGSLNLISVAFAVMFIGIAVDFGIQFGVRYREQHYHEPDHAKALRATAQVIAVPLAMAAGSTALGFYAFIPTDYRGVSELGLIAGTSMLIAFFLNLTLLPALMTLIKTPAEQEQIGFARMAPLNDFLQNHRRKLLPLVLVLTLAGLAVASHVRFDFDPLDLKDPHAESVSTMFDAMQDPDSDAYTAQTLAPSLDAAQALAAQIAKLPEVDHTLTLASFVPEDQSAKLAMIADTGALLAPTFTLPARSAPSDVETIDSLHKMAGLLQQAGAMIPAAKTLAEHLNALAAMAPDVRMRAQNNMIQPIQGKIAEIQGVTQVRPVTLDDIPQNLRQDWVTRDGHYLVQIFPKRGPDNNPRDLKILTRFIDAVRTIVPTVAGVPVSIRESGHTVVSAFIHAGIYGLISISLLSWLILRNLRDVGLMLAPLGIAGILTLATITLIGLPLNFANIIALPLLLSLGVSYAVYFVSYARMGRRDLLQSSVARAVLFSAGTVLVAFSSLCFSAHPGTRGMGELLTIALYYSLICTFLMLPLFLNFGKR